MYRSVRLRIQAPFPVTRFTADHPQVRVIVYNVAREPETPLPAENLYLARVPKDLRAPFLALIRERLDVVKEIPTPEPGVLMFHGRFRFPDSGPVRAFLQVLGEALGTVLSFRPAVIEAGAIDIAMITLPRDASTLRLRAIEEYARSRGIGFEIVEDRPVPHLAIDSAQATVLDLLEWQIIRALDAGGAYADAAPDDSDLAALVTDLADALGMDRSELDALRRRAERRLLHEAARAHARNVALATAPSRREPPTPS